jgi:hypothetical protein
MINDFPTTKGIVYENGGELEGCAAAATSHSPLAPALEMAEVSSSRLIRRRPLGVRAKGAAGTVKTQSLRLLIRG